MRWKFFGIFLAAVLVFSILTPVSLADGEDAEYLPEEETEAEEPEADGKAPLPLMEAEAETPAPIPASEAEPEAEEAPVPEMEAEETPAPEMEAEETPAPEPETEETPAPEETPVEEAPPAEEPSSCDGEAPPAEDGGEEIFYTLEDGDPMLARADKMNAVTAGTKTHSNFTTRALNNETLHKGIDVSAYQGSVNWSKVAASGVEFVIIRGAYRGYGSGKLVQDTMFTTYIKGAKAAGLKVGVYIFSQAITTAEAAEEADFLMNIVENYDIDLPLVLDYEHVSGGRLQNANLSRRTATDICNAFCARVEQSGYDSMVYANPYMLNNHLYASELGRLWLAHYISQTGYSGAKYEYWQCSDSGIVDGISGAVDLDFWFEPNGFPFKDVSGSAWYYDVVSAAYSQGIVTGTTADAFNPDGTATRGQVVTMLYRMKGRPDWKEAAAFEDLTQTYYLDAIYWAAETGAVNGFSETEFGPAQPITREQLVTILHRMAQCPQVEGDLSAYTDADSVQDWAVDAMVWAVEKSIVTGYEDATLKPQKEASRAEVCALLMRYEAL